MFIIDHETSVDLLYYDAIAEVLVRRVLEAKSKPITVGIHGDYGAGKSSILEMAAGRFRANPKILCLKFNGWQFQGFEDAKVALMESIITELRDAKKENGGLQAKATALLKRVNYLKIAKKSAPWIVSLFTGVPHPQQLSDALVVFQGLFKAAKGDLTVEKMTKAVTEAEGLLKPEAEQKIPEQVREFHKEFEDLIKTAGYEKLVVLIDDLDRCLPNTAIETLEAIRLFLFGPQTAFIIGADEAMIEYAVRQHFPDLPSVPGHISYARHYLEKLIQLPFRIPALGYAETQTYIALVLAEAGIGAENPEFKKLLPAARKCLSEPWNPSVFDQKVAKAAMFGGGDGNLPPEISNAITLSQQIARLLTDGTKGNPRQIKRFLNSMLLRNEIAEVRGFGAAIKKPVLAKIMLAEAFNPLFYDQLTRAAYASTDGKPKELASLEKAVRVEVESKNDAATAEKDTEGQKESEEWAKGEWIAAWAKCEPALADEDLRPYIFVTRDKRSYFGGAIGTGHLDPIVEALLGKELAIRQIEPELTKLTALEAEQVFDAVQNRVVQADDYSVRPAGLIALTRAKPALQRKLFTFLRDIPPPKVPGWVTTGLEHILTDAAIKTEWANTLAAWEKGGQSPKLKAALAMKRKPKS